MKKLTLAIVLLTAINSAHAATEPTGASVSILAGAWSQHWGDPYRELYNETNEMIGVVINDKYVVSKFTNSYYHESVMAAYNWKLGSVQYDDLSISANVLTGLVTGYKREEMTIAYLGWGLAAYVVPNVSFQYQLNSNLSVGFDLGFIGHKYGIGTTQNFKLTYKF